MKHNDKEDFVLFKIKSNGLFSYKDSTYHINQYTKDNPFYNPKINKAYKDSYAIHYKEERKNIITLTDDAGEFNIIPKRVNAILESQKNANYKYKKHEKVALNKSLYSKVMKLFFKKLLYHLIKTGYKINLPYVKLGSLQVCQKKSLSAKPKKYINFAESKLQGKTVYNYPKHWLNGYKPYFLHITDMQRTNSNSYDKTIKIDTTVHNDHYHWKLIRTALRPNSYNKSNNELTLVEYFNREGYKRYTKI